MGIFGWFDRRTARAQLRLAQTTLDGLAMVARCDRGYFTELAREFARHIETIWPRLGRDADEYLSVIRQRLGALTSLELFDRSLAALMTANRLRDDLPARADAVALAAHWLSALSLACGRVRGVQAPAARLAAEYAAAITALIAAADESERAGIPQGAV